MEKISQPQLTVTLVQKTLSLNWVKKHNNQTCEKNTFSVGVGGGFGDFTYQIILQSIFMTENYTHKNISKIVINI
jgi:hypothetical protein